MTPTRDHAIIRSWAHKYNATPAEIKPMVFDSEPAILTFLVGGLKGTPEIQAISWEAFFVQFDLLELSLAFDDNQSSRFDLVRVEKRSAKELQH